MHKPPEVTMGCRHVGQIEQFSPESPGASKNQGSGLIRGVFFAPIWMVVFFIYRIALGTSQKMEATEKMADEIKRFQNNPPRISGLALDDLIPTKEDAIVSL